MLYDFSTLKLNIFLTGVECGYPGSIRHGYIIGTQFSFDNRVRYACNRGYQLVGNETRYCTEFGEWEGLAPHCEGNLNKDKKY